MLNQSQITTLKALIAADQTAAALAAAADDVGLAAWLNQNTTFVVWKTSLSPEESRVTVVSAASQLDNLTVGKRDALLYLCNGPLSPNANLSSAFSDLCGSQTALKTALQTALYRNASRVEQALATGTGTAASPATLGYVGPIDYADASLLR